MLQGKDSGSLHSVASLACCSNGESGGNNKHHLCLSVFVSRPPYPHVLAFCCVDRWDVFLSLSLSLLIR